MNPLGIMQGRLSPPPNGRLQAFPAATWEAEFARARACGLDGIEWLFEADAYEQNPIWTASGLDRIRRAITDSSTPVLSICADYFMPHPFFRVTETECAASVAVLERLIVQASQIDVTTILLPVLEISEIRSESERAQLLAALARPLDVAAQSGVRIGLETELPADRYLSLVIDGGHEALGVYYDTGNAAARGYDVAADLTTLGGFLCGVHLKDRPLGGASVVFGDGVVDFERCFESLRQVGYAGPMVLQHTFGKDYMDDARRHRAFVEHARGGAAPRTPRMRPNA